VQRNVEVNSIDGETLLVNWLDELLHLQERQRENCSRFHIP
jgi:SHS2 domain-containing protein